MLHEQNSFGSRVVVLLSLTPGLLAAPFPRLLGIAAPFWLLLLRGFPVPVGLAYQFLPVSRHEKSGVWFLKHILRDSGGSSK